MTIRKFALRTQEGYIRAVKGFSAFLGASPDKASVEDLRRYQLHLVASGAGTPTINHTVTALRFLFRVTLRRPQVVARLPFIRQPRKLPMVLSRRRRAGRLEARPSTRSPPLACASTARHCRCRHGPHPPRRRSHVLELDRSSSLSPARPPAAQHRRIQGQ
jgi:hypothetical protein